MWKSNIIHPKWGHVFDRLLFFDISCRQQNCTPGILVILPFKLEMNLSGNLGFHCRDTFYFYFKVNLKPKPAGG